MFKSHFIAILLLAFCAATAFSNDTKSPEEFLGYNLGERVTFHHHVTAYFEHVAETSPMVHLMEYGTTYDRRPLIVAFVSSEENINRLEEIRTNNLIRSGLMQGDATSLDPKALVWFSYSIHGNEISGTEASMKTIYELITDSQKSEWLQNTVVIMDPSLNPDGRDRYAFTFHQNMGRQPDSYPGSREHIEPWPNARSNHYQFDLNRDWAWKTQIETQQRMALYHQWMPHLHADFHEMGINDPYYFPPAAEPFHEAITHWQREFQVEIGENHARHFDENIERYYTRENFDLFYPSYGDTYPTFNGAIGMTYEQAGNSRAGISVKTADGDILDFETRIFNQHVAGISTVEIASKNAARIANEFHRFFRDAASNPYSPYKTYVIKAESGRDKLERVTGFLDKLGISYGTINSRRTLRGVEYKTGEETRFEVTDQDVVISAYQPRSVLLNVLFEPKTTIIDSLTYDITSWAVPYAMGLKTYASPTRVNPNATWTSPEFRANESPDGKPYAYISKWQDVNDARFLSALLQENVNVRFTEKEFKTEGKTFEPGTLLIMRRGNEHLGDSLDEIVIRKANKYSREITATGTGLVTRGVDFGSASMKMIHAPKIALLSGPGVNVYNFGEIWHFLDRQIKYPVSIFRVAELNFMDLIDFDVLIFPDGWYESHFPSNKGSEIADWVRRGGNIVAIGNGIRVAASVTGIDGPELRTPEDVSEPNLIRFADRQRNATSDFVSGSIYRLELDNSHPLGFGFPDYYFTLKRGNTIFEYMKTGWNIGRLASSDAHLAGFTGYRAAERLNDSLIFGTHSAGQGNLVFLADNPLFRGFWYNGQLLFANSIFLIGQ